MRSVIKDPRFTGPLHRGLASGAAAGTVIGGAAASVSFPVAGTFFGAIYGAILGAALGLVLGLLGGLGLLGRLRSPARPSWAFRVACALIAAAAGAVVTPELAHTGPGLRPGWGAPALILSCTLAAGVLSTYIAYGTRLPLRGGRSPADVFRLGTVYGAAAGATVGCIAGLFLGLRFLPTVAFAIVEGGILGAVSGVVTGLSLAAVTVGIGYLRRW